MPSPTNAATAGAGASQRLPEQDQDADRCPARPREEGSGAEGVTAKGPAGTKGFSLLIILVEIYIGLNTSIY